MIADRPTTTEQERDNRALPAELPARRPQPSERPAQPPPEHRGRLRSAAERLKRFCFGETDLAPVGLFRILFGLQLINWFWQLYPNLTAFFTDDGLLTADALGAMRPHDFTLLAFASQPWQVHALWLLGLVAAVLLTIGYRTRLVCVLSFITVSLFVGRQPLITDGSDQVFRIVPLWLAFTAAGNAFALDAILHRRRGSGPSRRGPALPVRVLELQVACIYLSSGLEKLGGASWLDGSATSWVFQLTNTYARPWAAPLTSSAEVVHLTTWGTMALELAFLPLVFLPVWFRGGRWLAIAAAAGLHVGILVCMNVGNFPVVMLSFLVLFLPLRTGSTASPRVGPARLPFEVTIALAVLAVGVLGTTLPFVPGAGSSLLARVGLTQRWDMFAPDPSHNDGSLLVVARLADGSTIRLLPGTADSFYSRWQKVGEGARGIPAAQVGPMFCRAMRALAPAHDIALNGLDLIYIDRIVQPAGALSVVGEHTLWSGSCI